MERDGVDGGLEFLLFDFRFEKKQGFLWVFLVVCFWCFEELCYGAVFWVAVIVVVFVKEKGTISEMFCASEEGKRRDLSRYF